ncbi:MAG: endonuclease V-like protein UPF0215 family [Candidatus Nanohaloarchaea archaeon]|jgi:endonuclease V-like protein UPF0215 family
MKEGLRFLGIDDGPREAEKLIGVSYRGTEFMEQVEAIDQKPDGGESTEDILQLYRLFNQDIAVIFLDGISFNGFNVADIRSISRYTGKPVVAVTNNSPDKQAVRSGMESAGLDSGVVDNLPEVHKYEGLFIQFAGCDLDEAKCFVEKATVQGNIPEAVRAADLIGNAFQGRD